MLYIPYKNISINQFIEIKEKLKSIEDKVSLFMNSYGFKLNEDSYSDDFLGLDYLLEESELMGNIGLKYDEEISTEKLQLYSFYVLKVFDKGDVKFSKKETIEDNYTIETIVNDLSILLDKCMQTYQAFPTGADLNTPSGAD